MKHLVLILTFAAGCSRPIDNSGNRLASQGYVRWKNERIGDSLYILTDPTNGQEYIYFYGGGITPRIK